MSGNNFQKALVESVQKGMIVFCSESLPQLANEYSGQLLKEGVNVLKKTGQLRQIQIEEASIRLQQAQESQLLTRRRRQLVEQQLQVNSNFLKEKELTTKQQNKHYLQTITKGENGKIKTISLPHTIKETPEEGENLENVSTNEL